MTYHTYRAKVIASTWLEKHYPSTVDSTAFALEFLLQCQADYMQELKETKGTPDPTLIDNIWDVTASIEKCVAYLTKHN